MATSTETIVPQSVMKRWILLAICAGSVFSGFAHSETSATDRALQFLTNAHTGVVMQAGEWLTQEMQSSNVFQGFGGIERMVKQTTSQAHKFGGLRSVRILSVTPKEAQFLIRVEVTFLDDARRQKSPSKAESGEMIWNIRATKSKSNWMLSF